MIWRIFIRWLFLSSRNHPNMIDRRIWLSHLLYWKFCVFIRCESIRIQKLSKYQKADIYSESILYTAISKNKILELANQSLRLSSDVVFLHFSARVVRSNISVKLLTLKLFSRLTGRWCHKYFCILNPSISHAFPSISRFQSLQCLRLKSTHLLRKKIMELSHLTAISV